MIRLYIKVAMRLVVIAIALQLPVYAGEIFTPHCVGGCPEGVPASNDLIVRDIYTLSNNDQTKFADWVAYVVSDETIGTGCKRKWKPDPFLEESETLEPPDYKGAHAALNTDTVPQAPLASLCGTDNWRATNYLSNITPQKSALHQGAWVKLESRIRELALLGDPVYVLTGPAYGTDQVKLPGADEPHKVPTGYWKVIIRNAPDHMVTAFMFSQETDRKADYCDSMYTLDVLERKTGLNLLPDLEQYQPDDSICSGVQPSPFDCGC